jgi:glycolate oxidase FAD binding subunit
METWGTWLRERLGTDSVEDDPEFCRMYALNGIAPVAVAWPDEAQAVADVLGWASTQGLAVVPWGGGTQQQGLPAPVRYDLALSTTRLRRILEYEPAELVVTVETGITLAELATTLAPARQFWPISLPDPERATVGGAIATNAAGPERLRYGAARDLVLGVTVALADGSLVRGGGKVVKNVAGYDLTRLFTGSWGTLGVITSASLRLYPIPPIRQTLVVRCNSWAIAQAAALKLYGSPLGPHGLTVAPAIEGVRGRPASLNLFVRFGGLSVTVARQLTEARALVQEAGAQPMEVLDGEAEVACWEELGRALAHAPGMLLRVSVLPSRVAEAAQVLSAAAEAEGWPNYVMAHVGAGTVLAAWDAPPGSTLASVVTSVRAQITALGGWMVLQRAAPQEPPLDYWGAIPSGIPLLMRKIKAVLDPADTLNPGRFIVKSGR